VDAVWESFKGGSVASNKRKDVVMRGGEVVPAVASVSCLGCRSACTVVGLPQYTALCKPAQRISLSRLR